MYQLIALTGLEDGTTFPLKEETSIGRDQDNTIVLADKRSSRIHARITLEKGTYWIQDLQSSNGTFVNNQPIDKVALEESDQIAIGKTILLFTQKSYDQVRDDPRLVATSTPLDLQACTIMDADHLALLRKENLNVTHEQLKAYHSNLQTIYKINQMINSIVDLPQLLEKILDMVFDYFKADRGFVLLWNEHTEKLEPKIFKKKDGTLIDPKSITLSKTIIDYVMNNQKALLSSNTMTDERLKEQASILNMQLRSTMCVPLKSKDTILGILQVDSMGVSDKFSENDLQLLTAIGYSAGIAIQNRMLFNKVIQAEKLASIGQTIASLFHYMKNIMQGIKGGIEIMKYGFEKDKHSLLKEGYSIIRESEQRISTLVKNMLGFSKERTPLYQPHDLNHVIQEIVTSLKNRLDSKEVTLVTNLDTSISPFLLDGDGIHNALLNCITNALDAVEEKQGHILVTTKVLIDQATVAIQITDNGSGIPESVMRHIFDAFYSTKGNRGTGLGLSVTKKIVEEHGGSIELSWNQPQGTQCNIVLPYKQ